MSDDPKLKQAEKEFEENEVKKQERESAKKRVLADLENTSKKRIDFSKYEYNTKFSKQALLDLCEQYKVYADSDKSFVELFNLVEEFKNDGYGKLKSYVADVVCAELEKIQTKYREILASKQIEKILAEGAEKASYLARKKLAKVEKKIGLEIRY